MSLDLTKEPDTDAIKMFVGQIPRTWDEAECLKLLEEFGPIYQLNVLKDKNSTMSKGEIVFKNFLNIVKLGVL